MKKLLSLICIASLICSLSALPIEAETAVPLREAETAVPMREADIMDVLELLKFCTGRMDSVIMSYPEGVYNQAALEVSLLTDESKERGYPNIMDALEILKSLVGITDPVLLPADWRQKDTAAPPGKPAPLEATAPGIETKSNQHSVIDYSNADSGYVMVKRTAGAQSQIIVTGPGEQTCERAYSLEQINRFYPIPLQFGNGKYNIMVIIYDSGGVFLSLLDLNLTVYLSEPDINYLYPNIFVNYNKSSAAVKKSFDLCMDVNNDLEKVRLIYRFIKENFQYSISPEKERFDYIPNPDTTLSTKKGICSDFASLMTAMCRAQGIKTKLVFGYESGKYHAWVEVYIPQSRTDCRRDIFNRRLDTS
jgi:hypothetical protein